MKRERITISIFDFLMQIKALRSSRETVKTPDFYPRISTGVGTWKYGIFLALV